jgi:hypothetical protein
MITSKSPRMVLKLAYEYGRKVLSDYASPFSRRDFTEPQLFACLVLREHQKKSYRGIEALLADFPTWLAEIGMAHAPDHNTAAGEPSARPPAGTSSSTANAGRARRRTQ